MCKILTKPETFARLANANSKLKEINTEISDFNTRFELLDRNGLVSRKLPNLANSNVFQVSNALSRITRKIIEANNSLSKLHNDKSVINDSLICFQDHYRARGIEELSLERDSNEVEDKVKIDLEEICYFLNWIDALANIENQPFTENIFHVRAIATKCRNRAFETFSTIVKPLQKQIVDHLEDRFRINRFFAVQKIAKGFQELRKTYQKNRKLLTDLGFDDESLRKIGGILAKDEKVNQISKKASTSYTQFKDRIEESNFSGLQKTLQDHLQELDSDQQREDFCFLVSQHTDNSTGKTLIQEIIDSYPNTSLEEETELIKILKFMKEKGIRLNALNSNLESPLFFVKTNQSKLLKFLIKNGNNPQAKNCFGQTALDRMNSSFAASYDSRLPDQAELKLFKRMQRQLAIDSKGEILSHKTYDSSPLYQQSS